MLGITFTVDNVAFTNIDLAQLYININKNQLPVTAVTRLFDHDIALSHLAKEANREANQMVSMRYERTLGTLINASGFSTFKSNKPANEFKWEVHTGNQIDYGTSNLLLTGIFNAFDEPMFWRHEIPLASIEKGVEIFDQNNKPVDVNKFILIKEVNPNSLTHAELRGIVAHNLHTDIKKGIYYRIIYKDDNNDLIIEILNQQPLYQKSISDDNPSTSNLNSASNTYLLRYWVIRQVGSQNIGGFEFHLPDEILRFATRMTDESYIRGYLPQSTLPNEPWFLNISNFHWVLQNNVELFLPEFYSQSFSPHAPYDYVDDDFGLIINSNVVKVSNKGIRKTSISNLTYPTRYIKLLAFKEEANSPGLALTNDPSLDGTLVSNEYDILWKYTNLSTNYEKALIYTIEDLSIYSYATISYPYESHVYLFDKIDLNVMRNPSLRGKTIVFYLVPNYDLQTNSIEYLIHDEDLIIEKVSQDGTTSNPSIASMIGQYYSVSEGKNQGLNQQNTLGIQFTVGGLNFIDTYVAAGAIILGEISYPEVYDEGKSLITDVRNVKEIDAITCAKVNPYKLLTRSDSFDPSKLPIPSLISTQQIKIHWALFKDYNPSAKYTIREMKTRLASIINAGLNWVVSMEGVPSLEVKSIDFVNKNITVHWYPVSSYAPDAIIKGEFFVGTSPDAMSSSGFIANLSKTNEYIIAIGNNVKYIQLEAQTVVDTITKRGPRSNMIKFSFK